MSVIRSLVLLTFVLAAVFVLIKGQTGPSENCLGCICEGSSHCNLTLGCSSAAGYFCGPFLISYAYWSDAGQPHLVGDDPQKRGSFENCVLDLQCAADTVRGYMQKFTQDCDGDGVVQCSDYMRIHKLGGYSCTGPIDHTDYARFYHECATADCNHDGKIDCDDYIRIHGLGGYGCSDPSFVLKDFYRNYAKCMGVITAASGPQLGRDGTNGVVNGIPIDVRRANVPPQTNRVVPIILIDGDIDD